MGRRRQCADVARVRAGVEGVLEDGDRGGGGGGGGGRDADGDAAAAGAVGARQLRAALQAVDLHLTQHRAAAAAVERRELADAATSDEEEVEGGLVVRPQEDVAA